MKLDIYRIATPLCLLIAASPVSAQEASIENGKVLYAENCAACHGAKLEGQKQWQRAGADGVFPAPPHDVTGHTWHHGDKLLFDYTKFGGAKALAARGVADFKSGMPAFEETLSDGEIRDIWAFIKSTWPPQARAVQAERTAGEE